MTETTRPTKEALRKYFLRRTVEPLGPPPTPEEIKQQLDWHLLPLKCRPDWSEPE